jgi:hypothetical protein
MADVMTRARNVLWWEWNRLNGDDVTNPAPLDWQPSRPFLLSLTRYDVRSLPGCGPKVQRCIFDMQETACHDRKRRA